MNKNTESFEAAMQRLEEIVKALETGNAPLDQSLALFDEGVQLVKDCNKCLENAEQKVRAIVVKSDGSYGMMAVKDNV